MQEDVERQNEVEPVPNQSTLAPLKLCDNVLLVDDNVMTASDIANSNVDSNMTVLLSERSISLFENQPTPEPEPCKSDNETKELTSSILSFVKRRSNNSQRNDQPAKRVSFQEGQSSLRKAHSACERYSWCGTQVSDYTQLPQSYSLGVLEEPQSEIWIAQALIDKGLCKSDVEMSRQRQLLTTPIPNRASDVSLVTSASSTSVAERGVPEGQEDPLHASTSELSMSASQCMGCCCEKMGKLYRLQRSVEANIAKSQLREKAKKFAQDKLKRALSHFDLPNPSTTSAPSLESTSTEISEVDWPSPILDEEDDHLSPEEKAHGVFKCYVNYLTGEPSLRYLAVIEHHVLVLEKQVPLLSKRVEDYVALWQCSFAELNVVKVRYQYHQVHLIKKFPDRDSDECILNFFDKSVAQSALSKIAVNWNRSVFKASIERVPILVELNSELNSRLSPWLKEATCEKEPDVLLVSLIKWQEHHGCETPWGPIQEGYFMYHWTWEDKTKLKVSPKWHWDAGYFMIKAGVLYQFSCPDERLPLLVLPLYGNGISVGFGVNVPRPNCFAIRIGGGRLLLAASSREEFRQWEEAFRLGITFDPQKAVVQEKIPIPCGLVVTPCNLVLFQESLNFTQLAGALMDSIHSIGVGDDEMDNFCVIEFDCQEASEGSGDWILYFASTYDLNVFLNTIKRMDIGQMAVPKVMALSDETMLNECRQLSQHLLH